MFMEKTHYCQDGNSSQLDLQIQCNSNQNPSKLYRGYQSTDSKIYKGRQKTPNSQLNTEEEQSFIQSHSDQHSVVWVKEWIDQWNRTDSREADPQTVNDLWWESEGNTAEQSHAGTSGPPHGKGQIQTQTLHPSQQLNPNACRRPKWKRKTTKLLEDNVGENVDDLGHGHDTDNWWAWSRTDKLDYIKIKNLCSVKRNVRRMRRQATNWEKIFAKDTSDKWLLSKMYKQ